MFNKIPFLSNPSYPSIIRPSSINRYKSWGGVTTKIEGHATPWLLALNNWHNSNITLYNVCSITTVRVQSKVNHKEKVTITISIEGVKVQLSIPKTSKKVCTIKVIVWWSRILSILIYKILVYFLVFSIKIIMFCWFSAHEFYFIICL